MRPVHYTPKGKTVPLSIDFKSGDKIIINGAVIENLGSNSKISVHNQASVLRSKEVLSAEDCNTPAARIYFALQCAYVFPDKIGEYIKAFRDLLTEYVSACPSATEIANDILREVDAGRLYKGLKMTHKLISHEGDLLNTLEGSISEKSDPNGDPAG